MFNLFRLVFIKILCVFKSGERGSDGNILSFDDLSLVDGDRLFQMVIKSRLAPSESCLAMYLIFWAFESRAEEMLLEIINQ